jgi:thymidine kinase
MFSGKSERLLERLADARRRSIPAAAFKHASDNRYAEARIVTHSGHRSDAQPVASPGEILERAGDARLVVIDEAQFFGDGIIAVCEDLRSRGLDVAVAGLDRDSWGQPFGPMPALDAIADRVTRTRAVCSQCGEPADYTQRLAAVEDQTMIGGPEAYEPRCGRCFVAPPIELRR